MCLVPDSVAQEPLQGCIHDVAGREQELGHAIDVNTLEGNRAA